MRKIALGFAAGFFFFAFSAFATVIRVPQDQPTIQAGINAAVNGDTVLVGSGTFIENINFGNKGVLLRSEKGSDSTIIKTMTAGIPLARFPFPLEVAGIHGFTLVDTIVADGRIVLIEGGSVTLLKNVLRGKGWGVTLVDNSNSKSVSIDSCEIDGLGSGGIGIIAYNGSVVVRNSIIKRFGTGIDLAGPSNWVFTNNDVVNNTGLGLFFSGCAATANLRNNIISKNGQYGIYMECPHSINSDYNDVFSHTVVNYFGISPSAHDIQLDPLFTNELSDLNLQENSPCIDAGDPIIPVPPNGGARIDMGAFEFPKTGEFSLLIPMNNSFVLTRQPTLIWQNLRDTADTIVEATYRAFLSLNSNFVPTDTSPVLFDTSWQVPIPLNFFQDYFWKVMAVTDSGDTVFNKDNFRTFRVDAPPTIPILIEPSSGSETGPNSYLIWKKSTDGDAGDTVFYSLQVDDQPSFASPEISVSGLSEDGGLTNSRINFPFLMANTDLIGFQLNSLAGFGNLEDDTTYYWRVKAVDNHGADSGWTDGTNYFVFNATNSPPNPVIAGFSPSGGQTEIDLTPEISWFAASDPDPNDHPGTLHYNLLLDDDGEFDTSVQYQYPTAPGQNSFFVLDSLSDNTQWYYLVQTVDDEGATSIFSTMHNFFTNSKNDPPGNFDLSYPPNAEGIVIKAPVLDWENAIDPDPGDTVRYTLTLSADSQFLLVYNQPGLLTSSFAVPSGILSRGSQYFWKVKATDTRDSSSFGNQVFRFRVLHLGDANGDGILSGPDVVLILNYVFLGIPITPPEVADMNCDGFATSSDVVLALNAVFLGAAPPCDP